jgi:hypothetical protein
MDITSFIISDAINYGVEEAVFLWYMQKNMRKYHFEGKYLHNGEIWISLDMWDLKFAFPFWRSNKITKILKALLDKKVIKKKRLYEIRRGCSYTLAKQSHLE